MIGQIIITDWSEFKSTCIIGKNLPIQYSETIDGYYLYAVDVVVWNVIVVKGTADATDFETNYKPTSNAVTFGKFSLVDSDGTVATISLDETDGKRRLDIAGKVSISAPTAPPTSTVRTIAADTPLDVSSSYDTDYTIPNGVTFHITQVTYGGEGDPNEKGSKATIIYVDSSSVEHVVERIYFTGFTGQIFPDTKTARDNTEMIGNGSTTKIRVRRQRLGGAALEVDCVVRGYEI